MNWYKRSRHPSLDAPFRDSDSVVTIIVSVPSVTITWGEFQIKIAVIEQVAVPHLTPRNPHIESKNEPSRGQNQIYITDYYPPIHTLDMTLGCLIPTTPMSRLSISDTSVSIDY